MVQYVMVGCQNERKNKTKTKTKTKQKKKQKKKKKKNNNNNNNKKKMIPKFFNKEKDKKIYDVWVDRYVTVVFFF